MNEFLLFRQHANTATGKNVYICSVNPVIIIPARYASSRFPGKPLAKLASGHTVLACTVSNAIATGWRTVVTTDHPGIADEARHAGAEAIICQKAFTCGTERAAHTADMLGLDAHTTIINLQADEPQLPPHEIAQLTQTIQSADAYTIATIAHTIPPDQTSRLLTDTNRVKVKIDPTGQATWFGRKHTGTPQPHYIHSGIYAYTVSLLRHIATLPATAAERINHLEQLRWMQHGLPVRVHLDNGPIPHSIDTPNDISFF